MPDLILGLLLWGLIIGVAVIVSSERVGFAVLAYIHHLEARIDAATEARQAALRDQ